MISFIVPTMWRPKSFIGYVKYLVQVPVIGEVIIINNNVADTPNDPILSHPKVKLHNCEQNIYVNPAWNLGVELSSFDKVCISNDDIIVDLKVFFVLEEFLTEEIGMAGIIHNETSEGYGQPPFKDGSIDLIKWEHHYVHGFGSFFAMCKKNWVPIPKELIVYFGDNWVFDVQLWVARKPIYLISNALHKHQGSQTVTTVDNIHDKFYVPEDEIYKKMFEEMRIMRYSHERLENEYEESCKQYPSSIAVSGVQSDMYFHLPKLRELASNCQHVTQMGVYDGQATRAFLLPLVSLRAYCMEMNPTVKELFDVAAGLGKDVRYGVADSLRLNIEPTDLLFVDTEHTYARLSAELAKHHFNVRKYIVIHDTHMPHMTELVPAIMDFMIRNPNWRIKYHTSNCFGLTVLERIDQ